MKSCKTQVSVEENLILTRTPSGVHNKIKYGKEK